MNSVSPLRFGAVYKLDDSKFPYNEPTIKCKTNNSNKNDLKKYGLISHSYTMDIEGLKIEDRLPYPEDEYTIINYQGQKYLIVNEPDELEGVPNFNLYKYRMAEINRKFLKLYQDEMTIMTSMNSGKGNEVMNQVKIMTKIGIQQDKEKAIEELNADFTSPEKVLGKVICEGSQITYKFNNGKETLLPLVKIIAKRIKESLLRKKFDSNS